MTAGEEKATLEIELSKGDAITKWLKNGKEIDQSDRVQLKIDGKIKLRFLDFWGRFLK